MALPSIGSAAAAFLLCAALTACSSGIPGPSASSSSRAARPSTPAPAGTSTGSPTSASPSGPEAVATAALARLDRRAQIAQLFVAGVPLTDLASGDALVRSGVGGVFLAGRSTLAAGALAAITTRWQSTARGPRLWVAADQEGGNVQALNGPGLARLPTAVDQGGLPPKALSALADGMGASLHAAGLNLDLAPVVDVVPAGTERSNAPIGEFGRQYGSTPAAVSAAASTVVHGLARSGVTATLKHFPGLGRVRGNTDSAAITDTATGPDDPQVALFGALGRSSDRPFVMMSSAVYARIDPKRPAAFSAAVLDGLLRQRLGFDGVVVSDDLGNAKAVADVSPGDRAVRFLGAGGTLVLTVQPDLVPAMIDAVLARAAADPAFASKVDEAVHTALLAKARAGLLPRG
ncbi:MAG: Beta-N-acetylhexosaminidase [Blastococcus sp.]|jgi:beta-glucosidase-like glycosyl hydrolase|nr:Beta-N-acetylhexosaminidase [Blastococcus sp.]